MTVARAGAQAALRQEVARVTALLRSAPDGGVPALGRWRLDEVAMHLSQAFLVVPALAAGDLSGARQEMPSLAGGSGDHQIGDLWDLGGVTVAGVGSDPERDLAVLADRIESRADGFLGACRDGSWHELRPWLVEGTHVPLSVLACHLLSETMVHGYDMARAAGRRWPIHPAHAAMVMEGFNIPVLRVLEPRAMVDQQKAAGLRATFDFRVRGGGRWFFVFDDGALEVEDPSRGRVDCHISAEPAALLLVAWARRSQWWAIPRGKLMAWGRKPWLGLTFPGLICTT